MKLKKAIWNRKRSTDMHALLETRSIAVRYPKGFSYIVAEELQKMGLTTLDQSELAFLGTFLDAQALAKESLVLSDVLWPAVLMELRYFDQIDDAVFALINELDAIYPDQRHRQGGIKLHCSSVKSRLFHEKKIMEVFWQSLKKRHIPEGDACHIMIYLKYDKAVIYASLGHGVLHHRKLKPVLSAKAPLQEDLAQCLIRKFMTINDISPSELTIKVPFAGSGTFGFEAFFAFMQLRRCCLEKNKQCAHEWPKVKVSVFFSDTDNSSCQGLQAAIDALPSAIKNAASWQVSRQHFTKALAANSSTTDYVFLNPPFGKRLKKKKQELPDLYKSLGQLCQSGLRHGVLIAPQKFAQIFTMQLARPFETESISHGGLRVTAVYF